MSANRERGQAVVMFSLAAFLLLGILGMAVDLGWAYFRKEAAQSAAQAAAIAAAAAAQHSSPNGVSCGSNGVVCQSATACANPIPNPPVSNIDAGCLYASDNGFAVTAGGKQNVLMTSGTGAPPTTSGVTLSYWVTARVSESIPMTFGAVFGNYSGLVSARATVGVITSAAGGCIYIMQPNGTSVTFSGSASIQSGCGVYVNSNSTSAVLMSGTANITATGGSTVNIVGNWTHSGSAFISPSPNLGVSPAADPFASMQPPTVGTCTGPSVNLSGSASQTIDPGVYCSAILMSGSSHLTMNPGLYIIKSSINMSGTSSITANGVTLYGPPGGGNIVMSGTGGIVLTAPTSGPYSGIAVYMDRSSSAGVTLSGGTNEAVTGVIYMPNGALTYSGGSSTSGTSTTMVVKSVTFSGASYIANAATSPLGGGGGSNLAIVE